MWLHKNKEGQFYLNSFQLAEELIKNKDFKKTFSNEDTNILIEGIIGGQLDLEESNKKIIKSLDFIKLLFYIGEGILFLTFIVSLIILILK